MDTEERVIRGWLEEVGLCGLPPDAGLAFFRSLWAGGAFSFSEDQANLPSDYLLVSYVQPRGPRGESRSAWTDKAVRDIEEVHAWVSEARERETPGPQSAPSFGIWFDKLGRYMVDEAQSKWAAQCQLQFAVQPACLLIPESSNEYPLADLERPLVGVEAFDSGLEHATQCLDCRAEVQRLFARILQGDNRRSRSPVTESTGGIALVGLLHRCWPMAEALAAMEAHAAYLPGAGVRALLRSMAYAAIALRSWEVEHGTEITVGNDAMMELKAAARRCCSPLSRRVRGLSIWELEDLVEGQNHVSRMLLECKGTVLGTRMLERWAKLCGRSGRTFAEPVITRVLNMKEHLVLGPGANGPCYDEGDKLGTVFVNTIVANALAHEVRPGVIYDQDISAFFRFVIEEMLKGRSIWLPGRWLNLDEDSPFTWSWSRWKGGTSKGGFIDRNTGLLRVEALDALLRTHGLPFASEEVVKASTASLLAITDVSDVAFRRADLDSGRCPGCSPGLAEPVAMVLRQRGHPFPCARGPGETECESALLLEVDESGRSAMLLAVGIREAETSEAAWARCPHCGTGYHEFPVRAPTRLGVPGRESREAWVMVLTSSLAGRDYAKPLSIA